MSGAGWTAYSRAPLAVRAAVALAITLACLVIPALGDQWAYAHLHQARLYDLDWAMALRSAGTLYVWIPVALIIWLVQRERDAAAAKRRALLVIGSPVLAGLLCEVMKLLIRRERPDVDARAMGVPRVERSHVLVGRTRDAEQPHDGGVRRGDDARAAVSARALGVLRDRVGLRRHAGACARALPERRDVRRAAGVGGGVGGVDRMGAKGDGRWKIEDGR